ncbi:hypothetical protein [Gluconacetobacter azotocaptans]|nr:hypothetical protein [Gluconacetobacter azotocaptans]GBQ28755.1 hypothetical protein AA13594_1106 [Gluconacetobacter azotocaptans DSM 13594]
MNKEFSEITGDDTPLTLPSIASPNVSPPRDVHAHIDLVTAAEARVAFPSLPDDMLARIADDMNRQGFGVATDCIHADDLSALRTFIEHKVAAAGGEYIAFAGRESVRGTFLDTLGLSPEFMQACQTIYRKGTGKAPPTVPFYQVLRCLSGKTGEQHAFLFHYDSYVITALVPVIMPKDGKRGDLIMLPNTRGIRSSYFLNLLDKILLDNRLTQVALKRLIHSGYLRPTRVRMLPGNVYFFWGYRSVHANEPCDHDKTRATALFHYANPHAGSRLRGMARSTPGA